MGVDLGVLGFELLSRAISSIRWRSPGTFRSAAGMVGAVLQIRPWHDMYMRDDGGAVKTAMGQLLW
jgi:hypothetical protein